MLPCDTSHSLSLCYACFRATLAVLRQQLHPTQRWPSCNTSVSETPRAPETVAIMQHQRSCNASSPTSQGSALRRAPLTVVFSDSPFFHQPCISGRVARFGGSGALAQRYRQWKPGPRRSFPGETGSVRELWGPSGTLGNKLTLN